jgi:RNA polymerase sigma-70 factor, ECF subfamily
LRLGRLTIGRCNTGKDAMSDFHSRLEEQIPRLRRYARALTRDIHRADDLVQDTLVRALAKQHLWQAGTNLRAWLFTLMHNQHVNDVRRDNREGGKIDVEDVAAVLVANTDPTASRQLRELERGLARLPLEQRESILLVGLEGLRYDEAAAVLGVPIGTVRSRLSRGREALRKLMGMDEIDAPAAATTEADELAAAA